MTKRAEGDDGHTGQRIYDSTPEEAGAGGSAILRARVQEDPYRTLGLALGLGLVIGSGMWKVLARSLLGVGARLAVAAVVPAMLEGNSSHHQEA
jgi:hypothetical protein